MTSRTRFVGELRLAASVGLVGGALLGLREAVTTLEANALVQPGQYFGGYLASPVLSWIGLAASLAFPLAVLGMLRRDGPRRADRIAGYAAVFAAVGTLAAILPSAMHAVDEMRAVGVEPGFAGWLAIGCTTAVLAAAGAALVWAAVAHLGDASERVLTVATRAVLVALPVLLWPMVRFVATDWKWHGSTAAGVTADPAAPNVVLVTIDTLRADRLGSYGGTDRLTPHLDRLAAEGVVFRTAITSSPWTLPAIASLATGLHPHRHGAGWVTNSRDPLGRSPLPDGTWTLASALAARGYRTHAVVTNPYLALRYGLGAGFESYENVTIESELFIGSERTTAMRLLRWAFPGLVVGDRGETVSQRAVAWLDRAPKDRPFFLWAHYIDPHPPYSRAGVTRHKSFRGDIASGSDARNIDFSLTSPDVARLRSGELRLDDDEKRAVRALYDAEVASVDAAVGTVLDALDRLGLAERTLVVCVADHGEEFWEHGGVEHGHTVYEELVHVPLLVRWPGHLRPDVVDPLVRMVDVAPTILDLLGVAAPDGLDGRSARPLMQHEEPDARTALVESMLFAEERSGIRTRARKYVRWDDGKLEAYDLETDPAERIDVAAQASVRADLAAAFAAFPDLVALERRPGDGRPDPSAARALRALGYVR